VKIAAFALVFGLGSTLGLAQDRPQAPSGGPPTFRSQSALVALNVTVLDRAAKFVRGLQSGDFVVYEDGVKQDVRFCESTRVPLDLIVLIDTSASMRDKLDGVREAAAGLLKTLRPEDRGAVVTFANSVTVLQPLTPDPALLQAALHNLAATGNTSLNNAVYVSLKAFGAWAQHDGDVRRQAIVLLSDGADTSSLVSFNDVIELARRMGVSIYTVSLQSPFAALPSRVADRDVEEADSAMRDLAKETGAQSFFPPASALKQVYAAIASELASQYSIGYVPANGQPDGTFRRVRVQVITRPDVQSRTRVGYTAAAVAATPLPAVRTIGGGER